MSEIYSDFALYHIGQSSKVALYAVASSVKNSGEIFRKSSATLGLITTVKTAATSSAATVILKHFLLKVRNLECTLILSQNVKRGWSQLEQSLN